MRFVRPEGALGELEVRTIVYSGLSAYAVFTRSLYGFGIDNCLAQLSSTIRVQGDCSVDGGRRFA